jgi:predicted alpha/beta-hydrolase family hydrolase
MTEATTVDVDTPHGPARAHVFGVAEPRAGIVLGHGAGGGVQAVDLVTARDTALGLGVSVTLVEQPYRVAERRAPAPAGQLDASWMAVLDRLRSSELASLPLVVGGRSLGARIACRTAAAADAVGVLCLAFPFLPPRRTKPPASRLPELDAVTVPVLVVQGERDPFGMPPGGPNRTVVVVRGDHSLRSDAASVAAAVRDWLTRLLA